jgi:hypothetical protein
MIHRNIFVRAINEANIKTYLTHHKKIINSEDKRVFPLRPLFIISKNRMS